MYVREPRSPRESDLPNWRTSRDLLALFDANRTLAQMAILVAPATGVLDQHPIPTITSSQFRRIRPGLIVIGHAVSHAKHGSCCGGEHIHAFSHRRLVGKADIRAAMAIITEWTACKVPGTRPGIAIYVLLYHTVLAERAVDREDELRCFVGERHTTDMQV